MIKFGDFTVSEAQDIMSKYQILDWKPLRIMGRTIILIRYNDEFAPSNPPVDITLDTITSDNQ